LTERCMVAKIPPPNKKRTFQWKHAPKVAYKKQTLNTEIYPNPKGTGKEMTKILVAYRFQIKRENNQMKHRCILFVKNFIYWNIYNLAKPHGWQIHDQNCGCLHQVPRENKIHLFHFIICKIFNLMDHPKSI